MEFTDTPTKKTLDDIENFGIQFSNGFVAMKNLAMQNLLLARKYIVINETFDENNVRTNVEYHPNISIYSDAEKANILVYFDFLKLMCSKFTEIESLNGLNFYDIMNTRSRLDALIAQLMSGIVVG